MNISWKNNFFVANGDRNPVIILLGPTGVGKTQALEESFHTGFEVISADSGQVYRGCDIGTAKPTRELRKKIPHHLIDILDPDRQFTAGEFVNLADSCAKEIVGRGHVPVVSGGTAFYIRNFLMGVPGAPPADPLVRRELERECAEKGVAAMFEKLCAIDPESAEKIGPGDSYRILRALEIHRASGRPRKDFAVKQETRAEYGFLTIGLARERKELIDRINRRVDGMFLQGLTDEFHRLVQSGYGEEDPGMRGIGYAEFFGMGEGTDALEEIRETIKVHTRQYAKRQMTFFRKIPGVTWFHPDDRPGIEALVRGFLSEWVS